MTVRALLAGHAFDLETLVDMFPEGDPCVVKDDDGRFHLEATELDPHMHDAGLLVEIAERVLANLVGTARLQHGDFQKVDIAGSFEKWAGSTKFLTGIDRAVLRERVVVARAETATIRASARAVAGATHPDGEVAKPEPAGARYQRLAKNHPAAAELIALLGKSDMGWADLYKAYEIVRDASKGGRKPRFSLDQLGYDKPEVDNFSQTVNLHRHARPSGRPPKRKLTLPEAQQFTRDMAERWFRMLENADPGS